MRFIYAILLVAAFSSLSFSQDETAPITEKKFDYFDWTYKDIQSGDDVNLRRSLAGKRLVMVFYWAPWCHNTRHDIGFVQSLYEKYKDKGFEVIGVGLYDPVDRIRSYAKQHKVTFPNVVETTSLSTRLTSSHYAIRTKAGDTRKWGTPWYIFIDPANIEATDSSVIARELPVVFGELRRGETELFIRKKLGLD